MANGSSASELINRPSATKIHGRKMIYALRAGGEMKITKANRAAVRKQTVYARPFHARRKNCPGRCQRVATATVHRAEKNFGCSYGSANCFVLRPCSARLQWRERAPRGNYSAESMHSALSIYTPARAWLSRIAVNRSDDNRQL